MDVHLEFDREQELVRVRISGAFDGSVLEERMQAFYAHPELRPGMDTVFDVRDLDVRGMTSEDMEYIGSLNRDQASRRGEVRVALLVDGPLQYGIWRMHEVLGESPNLTLRVYRDPAEAEAWIRSGKDGTPPGEG